MIRGALASRYGISPLGRGVIRPASGGWWLSGGIAAANCIAAYQPKGAADYATSKVNLANPGTYDAADGAAYPTWDASTGWTFVKANSQYLNTGYVPTINAGSIIVRFQSLSNDLATQGLCGCSESIATTTLMLSGRWGGNQTVYGNGALGAYNPSTLSGVLAMAGLKHYKDGSYVNSCGAGSGTITKSVLIGGINGYSIYYCEAQILALAMYSVELDATQIGLLTTAMAAL